MIYAENEIWGNTKSLLTQGCLLSISLLMPGSTVSAILKNMFIFHGSASKVLTRYQKILWICLLLYENLSNFTWNTVKFQNCHHVNEYTHRRWSPSLHRSESLYTLAFSPEHPVWNYSLSDKILLCYIWVIHVIEFPVHGTSTLVAQ